MTDDIQNELLASLDSHDYGLLRPHLTRIRLEQHAVLQQADYPIENVFFPLDGMVSLLASVPTGEEIEIAGIGREGAIGTKIGFLPLLSFSTAIVQLPGIAMRMPLTAFQAVAAGNIALTHIATCANDILLCNLQQAAACNAIHGTEARLARWLLQALDRQQGNELPLTQEFLGQMLGVRRTTVTVAASALEQSGLVEYRRGKIHVLDRPGLEEAACGCYRVVEKNIAAVVKAARRAKIS
ncbi:Crp/Fnr family transcriptional regulator [Rhodoplanes sp. Z2-YC6860]|uniref:Crp/Fnr family transcriptional regulator n=1 Tax=Rhodoplanes sp. Z2-YC6860 TaxID=674703 RepID=UPI00078C11CC|nr:Crp/Fnr family transcriptional regulator [Rhodoplanes sp. Z2-YC6860]AMN40439.1 Crp/FNR family transcriptional regulator [Rhodoplanes sp. Z2-YC6860]